MRQQEDPYFESERTRQTPFIQGDSDLIFAFSEPEAKDYDEDFRHINRDIRMAFLKPLDMNYANISYPLLRSCDDVLGLGSRIGRVLNHNNSVLTNISVSNDGFAMKTLVTRKQEQRARIIQDSAGFFQKQKENQQEGL